MKMLVEGGAVYLVLLCVFGCGLMVNGLAWQRQAKAVVVGRAVGRSGLSMMAPRMPDPVLVTVPLGDGT